MMTTFRLRELNEPAVFLPELAKQPIAVKHKATSGFRRLKLCKSLAEEKTCKTYVGKRYKNSTGREN